MAKVISPTNSSDFNEIINKSKDFLVVVHFFAAWAPQCKQINDILEELTKDTRYVNCSFVKVEAEAVPEISQKYEINAVPTCVLLRHGSVVDRVDGANVPELTRKVEIHGSPGANLPALDKQPKEDIDSRLRKLVKQAPVMIFMKGSPQEPRCGFSRQLMEIMANHNVRFDTFDILQDDDVRQGLKKFSDWPTYPQVYVDGELIGGLDIIKDMVESGEFKNAMPEQESLDDRLKKLISKEPVMLFMKGDPQTPRCGFSKTTIELLNSVGAKYGTFDILEDNEVRQGLKTFSDWPTYPQLYVNGELIGGLDILKELHEGGELESTLKSTA